MNEPIQVRDTYLEPGQYVFKLLDSQSDRHIVQIYNATETHLINTVMAVPNYRIQPAGNSRFLFWETPPGNAKALRAWFYPGDNFGQEFPYPKHLRTVTVASAAQTAVPAPLPPPAAPEAQAEVQQNEQVEVAQNTPPPPPAPEAEAQPEPTPQPAAPQVLPKTASEYPLIGLAGLLSLGVFGLLRLKKPA